MSDLIAVYDACVLYPAPLRDLLMQLAMTDLFRARWTSDIHEEWISSLLANRPDLKREQLERTRDLMNQNAHDCLVAGYHALIPALTLPDSNDRHVLAAAIVARADVIVTFNLSDFPPPLLEPYGVKARHPNAFIRHQLDLSPEIVFLAVQRQRQSLRHPSKTVEELLNTLEQQGLVETVAYLRRFSHLL